MDTALLIEKLNNTHSLNKDEALQLIKQGSLSNRARSIKTCFLRWRSKQHKKASAGRFLCAG